MDSIDDLTLTATTVSLDDEKVRRVELLISNLLRIGVIVSVVVVLIGITLTFVHHPEYRTSHEALVRLIRPGASEFPTSLPAVWQGLMELQGRAVVVLGLLLLVATPILRVAASVFAFWYEKDWRFVGITLVVLGFLVLSFFLGKGE
jgi:uncharacterized membrane protein